MRRTGFGRGWIVLFLALGAASPPAAISATRVRLVKDINAAGSSSPTSLGNARGSLFFAAFDRRHGRELWRSDGTAKGTTLVKDIRRGADSSLPRLLTNVNGRLFFSAFDGRDVALWRSDGTAGGTVLVKDLDPGEHSSSPRNLTNADGTLYFSARDPAHGREFWKAAR